MYLKRMKDEAEQKKLRRRKLTGMTASDKSSFVLTALKGRNSNPNRRASMVVPKTSTDKASADKVSPEKVSSEKVSSDKVSSDESAKSSAKSVDRCKSVF
jgi:hypothetical protein